MCCDTCVTLDTGVQGHFRLCSGLCEGLCSKASCCCSGCHWSCSDSTAWQEGGTLPPVSPSSKGWCSRLSQVGKVVVLQVLLMGMCCFQGVADQACCAKAYLPESCPDNPYCNSMQQDQTQLRCLGLVRACIVLMHQESGPGCRAAQSYHPTAPTSMQCID